MTITVTKIASVRVGGVQYEALPESEITVFKGRSVGFTSLDTLRSAPVTGSLKLTMPRRGLKRLMRWIHGDGFVRRAPRRRSRCQTKRRTVGTPERRRRGLV